MSNYTISYSETAQGWPSFYTYDPDWLIGMNNYFYSFRGGNLFRHDTGTKLTFYNAAPQAATLQGVFNTGVLESKLWKTISLESDEAWDVTLSTDLQTGNIEDGWFDKKEGIWYAFIRANNVTPNYLMRSVNGLAEALTVDSTNLAAVVITFATPIGSIISIGDTAYYGFTPSLAGAVTATTATSITVDTTLGTPPVATDFILYVKDSVAESHGVLGRYCIFVVSNAEITDGNLFSVKSEYFKSFP